MAIGSDKISTYSEHYRVKNMEKNQKLTPLAQALRKNQTKEEGLLWYRFLSKYPLRFRRQYTIGNYIVDFYCHKAKVAIELDGSQHYCPITEEYDIKRSMYLESQGVMVLRYSNLDVLKNFPGVCEHIDRIVKQRESAFSTKTG